MTIGQVEIQVAPVASARDFQRAVDQALANVKGHIDLDGGAGAGRSSAALGGLGKQLDASNRKAQALSGALGAIGSISIVNKLRNIGKESVRLASDLGETANVVSTTFGSATKSVNDFSKSALKNFGLARNESLRTASSFAGMIRQFEQNQAKVAELSTDLTALTGDLASFYNTTSQQASQAISSALRGESESIRRYNVILDEASVKQAAYSAGIAKQGAELNTAQKVQARYLEIVRQTALAHGDFSKTSGSLANQQRILANQVGELKTTLGETILPFVVKFTQGANALLGLFQQMPGPVQKTAVVIAGLGIAAAASAVAVANLNRTMQSLQGTALDPKKLFGSGAQGAAGSGGLLARLTGKLGLGGAAAGAGAADAGAAAGAAAGTGALGSVTAIAGPIVAVIALLGAQFALGMKYSKSFRGAVSSAFKDVKQAFYDVKDAAEPVFHVINMGLGALAKALGKSGVGELLTDVLIAPMRMFINIAGGAANLISDVVGQIDNMVMTAQKAINKLIGMWNAVPDFLRPGDKVKDVTFGDSYVTAHKKAGVDNARERAEAAMAKQAEATAKAAEQDTEAAAAAAELAQKTKDAAAAAKELSDAYNDKVSAALDKFMAKQKLATDLTDAQAAAKKANKDTLVAQYDVDKLVRTKAFDDKVQTETIRRRLYDAAKGEADATRAVTAAIKAESDASQGVIDSKKAVLKAEEALNDARKNTVRLLAGLPAAEEAYRRAQDAPAKAARTLSRALEDQRFLLEDNAKKMAGLTQNTREAADAFYALIDAKLAAEGGAVDSRLAELRLSQATDATRGVQGGGYAQRVAEAQAARVALDRARLAESRQNLASQDATAKKTGVEPGSREWIMMQRGIEDAESAVKAAKEGVFDATEQVRTSEIALQDYRESIKKSREGEKDADENLAKARKGVTAAEEALSAATRAVGEAHEAAKRASFDRWQVEQTISNERIDKANQEKLGIDPLSVAYEKLAAAKKAAADADKAVKSAAQLKNLSDKGITVTDDVKNLAASGQFSDRYVQAFGKRKDLEKQLAELVTLGKTSQGASQQASAIRGQIASLQKIMEEEAGKSGGLAKGFNGQLESEWSTFINEITKNPIVVPVKFVVSNSSGNIQDIVAQQNAKGKFHGGRVEAGMPYIVGENHPGGKGELFTPRQSGVIVSAREIAQAFRQAGIDGRTVNINTTATGRETWLASVGAYL